MQNNQVESALAGLSLRYSWCYAKVLKLHRPIGQRSYYETNVTFRSDAGNTFDWWFEATPNFVAGQRVALLWCDSPDGRHALVGYTNVTTGMLYSRASEIKKFWNVDQVKREDPFMATVGGLMLLAILFCWLPSVLEHWRWLVQRVGAEQAFLIPFYLLAASAVPMGWFFWWEEKARLRWIFAPSRGMEMQVFELTQQLYQKDPRRPKPVQAVPAQNDPAAVTAA